MESTPFNVLSVAALITIIFFATVKLADYYYSKKYETNKKKDSKSIIKTTNDTSYEPDINNIFDYTGEIWRRNTNIK